MIKLEPNIIDKAILNVMKRDIWYTSYKLCQLVDFGDNTIKKSLFKLSAMNKVKFSIKETKQSSTGYKYIWRRF